MMHMLIMALALLTGAAHAQVFKCQEGGRTVYSQAPCAGAGALLDAHRPAPGGAVAPRAPVPQSRPQPVVDERPAAQAKACPTEQEIANMQTSASSRFLTADERRLWAEDIRRARACQPLMTQQEKDALVQAAREQNRPLRCMGSSTFMTCR